MYTYLIVIFTHNIACGNDRINDGICDDACYAMTTG